MIERSKSIADWRKKNSLSCTYFLQQERLKALERINKFYQVCNLPSILQEQIKEHESGGFKGLHYLLG